MPDANRPAEPPTHPLRPHGADDPPPPRREQLPLPRRSQQDHLAPELRVPGGSGNGTPFTPFAAFGSEPSESAPGDAPAAFHAGTARGRADTDPDLSQQHTRDDVGRS